MTIRKFLISWNENRLDSLSDITQYETQWGLENDDIIHAINNTKMPTNPVNHIYTYTLLRARFNSHHYFEVYGLITEDISEEEIEEMFNDNPQQIVDIIRTRGVCFYDNKRKENKIKII